MKRISDLKVKLLLTAGYLFALVVLHYFGASCVFQSLLDIPCPGCGMTRAILATLRLDFPAAFSYHGMFWSMPILYLYFLTDGKLFKNKRLNRGVFIAIVIGFLLSWIVNINKIL